MIPPRRRERYKRRSAFILRVISSSMTRAHARTNAHTHALIFVFFRFSSLSVIGTLAKDCESVPAQSVMIPYLCCYLLTQCSPRSLLFWGNYRICVREKARLCSHQGVQLLLLGPRCEPVSYVWKGKKNGGRRDFLGANFRANSAASQHCI